MVSGRAAAGIRASTGSTLGVLAGALDEATVADSAEPTAPVELGLPPPPPAEPHPPNATTAASPAAYPTALLLDQATTSPSS